MTRLEWMLIKACVPAGIVAVGSIAVAYQLKGLAFSPVFGGIAVWAPWVALIGFIAASGMVAVRVFRIWRWGQGDGPICRRCGGPLGHKIDGRYGEYRRCMACDATTSARYYS